MCITDGKTPQRLDFRSDLSLKGNDGHFKLELGQQVINLFGMEFSRITLPTTFHHLYGKHIQADSTLVIAPGNYTVAQFNTAFQDALNLISFGGNNDWVVTLDALTEKITVTTTANLVNTFSLTVDSTNKLLQHAGFDTFAATSGTPVALIAPYKVYTRASLNYYLCSNYSQVGGMQPILENKQNSNRCMTIPDDIDMDEIKHVENDVQRIWQSSGHVLTTMELWIEDEDREVISDFQIFGRGFVVEIIIWRNFCQKRQFKKLKKDYEIFESHDQDFYQMVDHNY